MSGLNYNKFDKLSHLLYLDNYLVSKSSYYLDKLISDHQLSRLQIDQSVFVTGLARAGTTILFNTIFNSNEYAAIKYSGMPFLLMPNIWSIIHKSKKTDLTERAHGDGIMFNQDSPEAFDEYFWKVFLKDIYISEKFLLPHSISDVLLSEYLNYIKLVCVSQKKTKYLSKNNNNILRLHSISKLKANNFFLLVYRNPGDHAMSLLKEHKLFSSIHINDHFSLKYFDLLGHHEFGLHHKPFLFNTESESELACFSKDEPDYWLCIWKQYYRYVIEQLLDFVEPLCFEDYANNSAQIASYLNKTLKTQFIPEIPPRKKTSSYEFSFKNKDLYEECMHIFNTLNNLRRYV